VADVDEDAVRTVADELGGDEEWDEDIPKMFPETSGKRPRQPRKNEQKIKIKLRSYWVPRIEEATNQIMEAAKTTETKAAGPIRLPTRRRKWTVLTSPHVNKDAREQFELRTHRRLIELINPTAQAVDALMQLNLPAGVDVQVKLS
jgi:small subunit ribosomal protein S10